MSDPESLLKKLRRLETNRICPNCGTTASALGFGNVCVKFRSFVCDMCKTSHQAISHRVKSITMSTWTIDEVNDLTEKNLGGNKIVLETWLANAPNFGERYTGGARPKEGDKIEIFKKFIVDCYEKELFRGLNKRVVTSETPEINIESIKRNDTKVHSKPEFIKSTINIPTSLSEPKAVNLLDDDFSGFVSAPTPAAKTSDFDAFSSPSTMSMYNQTSKFTSNSVLDNSSDFFGVLQSAPSLTIKPNGIQDEFLFSAFQTSTSTAAENQSSNNMLSRQGGFDAFGDSPIALQSGYQNSPTNTVNINSYDPLRFQNSVTTNATAQFTNTNVRFDARQPVAEKPVMMPVDFQKSMAIGAMFDQRGNYNSHSNAGPFPGRGYPMSANGFQTQPLVGDHAVNSANGFSFHRAFQQQGSAPVSSVTASTVPTPLHITTGATAFANGGMHVMVGGGPMLGASAFHSMPGIPSSAMGMGVGVQSVANTSFGNNSGFPPSTINGLGGMQAAAAGMSSEYRWPNTTYPSHTSSQNSAYFGGHVNTTRGQMSMAATTNQTNMSMSGSNSAISTQFPPYLPNTAGQMHFR